MFYLSSYLKYALIFGVLIVVQVSFVWLIAISKYNITPDLVIVMVIYMGYSKGHIPGMVSGFLAGLTLDIMSGTFIGLSALSYSIAGFVSGYFGRKVDEKSSRRFSLVGVIFVCTLVAYVIFYMIYFQGSGFNAGEIFLKYVITTTFYTSIFGLIFTLIFNRFDLKKTF